MIGWAGAERGKAAAAGLARVRWRWCRAFCLRCCCGAGLSPLGIAAGSGTGPCCAAGRDGGGVRDEGVWRKGCGGRPQRASQPEQSRVLPGLLFLFSPAVPHAVLPQVAFLASSLSGSVASSTGLLSSLLSAPSPPWEG